MDGRIYNDNEKRKKQGLPPLKNPYRVVYRIPDPTNGSMKQTQKRGFKTKNDAQQFLNNVQQRIITNDFVQPQATTLKEYLTDWMKTYVEANCKQSTVDGYRVNVEKHIIPALGHIKLQKLTVSDIEKFYRQKHIDGRLDNKGGLSGKSILYIHRNLSEALEQAVRKRIITYNPAKGAVLPKVQKFHSDVFSHGEILDILEKIKNNMVETPFALAALSGLRRGECLGLSWDDVDFSAKTITVRRQLVNTTAGIEFITPKTEESIRVIMATDELLEVLSRHNELQENNKRLLGNDYIDNNLVCCRPNGELINPGAINKLYNNALERNGFTPVRFHDLRHSFATYMIRLGVPINVVSKMLGHKSVAITMEVYVHVLNEMQQEAIEKQNAAFQEYRLKKEPGNPDIVKEECVFYIAS